MKHIIIGTAGHVDHGKTALIRALTGIDTDRLQEEKQRGISIDLGFAAMVLGPDIMAGIVDVPGHKRFLKNMLAGTGGIDMVLLVIAADEGVMPQTREHLAMLNLYGIRYGVVAVNKVDKVESDWLELVEEDIGALLKNTFLAGAPLCRVSAATGTGMENLRSTIGTVALSVSGRDSSAPFRMWIDRVFVVKGHGVVVTGSVLSGKIGIGDSLQLLPGGESVRVRGLESHGEKTAVLCAGQRAAINLAGTGLPAIERGMALTAAGHGQVGTLWDVGIDWCQEAVTGMRIRLHIGTAEYLGRLHAFKDGTDKLRRLLLEEPLGAAAGDRGILRRYSPQQLLGGVSLISLGRSSRRLSPYTAELAAALSARDLSRIVHLLPARNNRLLSRDEISRQAGYYPEEAVNRCLQAGLTAKTLVTTAACYATPVLLDRWTQRLEDLLQEYHREQPERPGMPREAAREKLGLSEKEFEAQSATWQKKGLIVLSGAAIALVAHAEKHSDWRQNLVNAAEVALIDTELISITPALLGEKLQLLPERTRAAHEILLAAGVLVKVGELIVYRKTMQYIAKVIQQHFAEHGTLTVAELRNELNTSRKVALPVLEYFDVHKYTIREGDIRRKGKDIIDLSE
jgi:selenocysteine-specific elongation factor